MKYAAILISLCLTLVLPACTLIDSTLTLKFEPLTGKISAAPSLFTITRVSDRRADQRRIGCKKNGLGSESADLFLDAPLTSWFSSVVKSELERAGFLSAKPQDAGAIRMEIDIIDFFIEPDVGMGIRVYAVVNAEVTVRFPDGSAYARRFAGISNDSAIVVTDGDYSEQILSAMSFWVQQAVGETARLISNHTAAAGAAPAWRTVG
jgi:hypothetical protein